MAKLGCLATQMGCQAKHYLSAEQLFAGGTANPEPGLDALAGAGTTGTRACLGWSGLGGAKSTGAFSAGNSLAQTQGKNKTQHNQPPVTRVSLGLASQKLIQGCFILKHGPYHLETNQPRRPPTHNATSITGEEQNPPGYQISSALQFLGRKSGCGHKNG